MKVYDILKAGESILKMLGANGVDIRYVEHLEMYEEYVRLESEGHKKTYIVYYLMQQYDVGRATVYRVVNEMRRAMKV